MKKARNIISIIILVAVVGTIMFIIGKKIGLSTDVSETSTTIEEKTIEKRTIKKTLTCAGEIKSSSTDKLELSDSKYFESMCMEEDDLVKKGAKLVKYTDGTYLKAPYDLVVSSYSVPKTQKKTSSDNYVEVQNAKNLLVSINVSENEIANISNKQKVEVVLTADTNKKYMGEISKIDAVGNYDTSGTTFPVEVSLKNDGDIRIGMSVSCTINIKELEDVVAAPINGVQINGNRKYVMVVKDGKEEEVDITTGLADDEYVQVLSGLNGGETIIVTTETKQNTIRNNKNNFDKRGSNNGFGGQMPGGEGDYPSRPDNMNRPDFNNASGRESN